MNRLKQIIVTFLLVLTLFGTAMSQDNVNSLTPTSLAITARASGERVRITAPSSIVQMHLEIYASGGEKLFDNEIRGGNVFDWHLQDGQAQRLVAGDYLCVVTVKNVAGRISQKIGTVRLSEKEVTVGIAESAKVSPQQSQAIGPVEENSSWTVLSENENQTTTVIAHDGTDGQIVRGRGAFSFRLGDFFSGNDQEQMRLTAEGNLGIGTAKPQFKLDVAGAIRARQGFVFNDGSTLNVNDKGVLTHTSPDGTVTPNVGGIGSQGRLAKWTDNSGNLGDSLLGESGSNIINNGASIQMTAAPSTTVDTNLIFVNSNDRTTGMIASSTPSFTSANGPYFAMRGNTYSAFAGQRGLFAISAGSVSSPTGREGSVIFNTGNDQIRMLINPAGRVGIGTDTPARKLDVAGDINTSNDYNIGGNRVLSVSGGTGGFANTNTFTGVGAGTSTTPSANDNPGNWNSYFGYHSGQQATTSTFNSFFGASAGEASTGSRNSFFGMLSGFAASGSSNSIFGAVAGAANVSSGSHNSFFGDSAGSSNSSGSNNSFFGNAAGELNTEGGRNTFYGDSAGAQNSTGGGNTFFGASAGVANLTGSFNTAIGQFTNLGSGNLDHATAIGADAVVSSSNTIALGRSDGSDIVDVPGKLQIDTLATAGSTGPLCLNSSNRVGQCSSSLRYKTAAQPFLGGLNIIQRLRPITFTWKDGGMRDIGLGAEEVTQVEPLLTFRNRQGEIEGVKYNQLSAVLINAIKEQQQQIRDLQDQIIRMRGQVQRRHRHPARPPLQRCLQQRVEY